MLNPARTYLDFVVHDVGTVEAVKIYKACYGNSCPQDVDESGQDWLEKVSEQDYEDGLGGCLYPDAYKKCFDNLVNPYTVSLTFEVEGTSPEVAAEQFCHALQHHDTNLNLIVIDESGKRTSTSALMSI